MAGLGRLQPSAQYYQGSGESSTQEQLPSKFITTNPATSPISDHLATPQWYQHPYNTPVVQRAERTIGMRYMYGRGAVKQPIMRLGADGPPNPWISSYQPYVYGMIHNGGFNDALYQAGYPGFNLGLSFKVPTLPQNLTVPTRGWQKMYNITQKMVRVKRATGQPENT